MLTDDLSTLSNNEKGMYGEQCGSDTLYEIGIDHEHHDFTSIKTYVETQGKGVDIWNDSLYLYIESKFYPNSELTTEIDCERSLQSRFKNIPLHAYRLTVVIRGVVSKLAYRWCNRRNILLIHVENEQYLKDKFLYYFTKIGLIKHNRQSYKNRYQSYVPYTLHTTTNTTHTTTSTAVLPQVVFSRRLKAL